MKKIFYKKLVRDKIPSIIKGRSSSYSVRTLSPKAFEHELVKKVGEEASGMLAAHTRRELVSELADIIDVLEEIKRVKKIPDRQISTARQANFKRKGGFRKRLFLVWSSDDGYRSN